MFKCVCPICYRGDDFRKEFSHLGESIIPP